MNNQTIPPVVILTDFGLRDAYVGSMKGVILRMCPGVPIIDLTHEIEPQSVRQAAFVLWTAYRYFPVGTTFLVVVDPGVGSVRHPIAIQTEGFNFVGPDNGVFTEVLAETGSWRAIAIDEKLAVPEGLTATFHGRDLFAPTTARIACGQSIDELGVPLDALIQLPQARLHLTPDTIEGEVIYIDHFGNVVTSIGLCTWFPDGRLSLTPRLQDHTTGPLIFNALATQTSIGENTFSGIARTYGEVNPNQATVLINSAGQLEIAVNQGNAHDALGVNIGDRIIVRLNA